MRLICMLAAVAGVASSVQTASTVSLPSDWKKRMTFRERMIAGAAARGVAQTTLHPIDVVRTRLQAKGVKMVLKPSVFVKGIAPQFFLAFPAGGLQFAAYEFCKARAAAADLTGGAAEVLCGAAGALAASVIRVPQEVLKQRVQADIYPNALVGFTKLISTEGPAGFYKGYTATISRDVPWNALSFLFFAQSKTLFTKTTGEAPSMKENLVLGALSGMAAAAIMTPVDVVKTRLMTGGASGGIIGTAAAILREEGAATFMKGIVPRIAYLAPMASLTLSFYESFGKALITKRLNADGTLAPP
eukprot:CAMPEP_0183352382 /NCGR_PEP_ID=MMETSP0164_2-20130417/29403_1 /TAXON_ID=221442 /ORGANISM="Coccolithus pelagicus ssp braarudi, Strain PLY182g" /LENGTH=301 /DNA_ID=CAMNT_0025524797 /DNA_START=22 /DNA_END=927 /DNA_ORIENTATION=+